MSVDRCLELVAESGQRKPWSVVESWIVEPLERLGLHARTPHDRIVVAVGKEIADLIARATAALGALATDEPSGRAVDHAKEVLARGSAERRFPREELRALLGRNGHGAGPPTPVRTELEAWMGRHEALERRVKWLLDPRITRDQLASLDPIADSDQIWCSVRYDFSGSARTAFMVRMTLPAIELTVNGLQRPPVSDFPTIGLARSSSAVRGSVQREHSNTARLGLLLRRGFRARLPLRQ